MPCYDGRSLPSRAEAEREWRHNNPVASLLCEAMKIITEQGVEWRTSPELKLWWHEHKIRDAQRKG